MLNFAINFAGVDQWWLIFNSSDSELYNLRATLNTTDWSTSECLKVKRKKYRSLLDLKLCPPNELYKDPLADL